MPSSEGVSESAFLERQGSLLYNWHLMAPGDDSSNQGAVCIQWESISVFYSDCPEQHQHCASCHCCVHSAHLNKGAPVPGMVWVVLKKNKWHRSGEVSFVLARGQIGREGVPPYWMLGIGGHWVCLPFCHHTKYFFHRNIPVPR